MAKTTVCAFAKRRDAGEKLVVITAGSDRARNNHLSRGAEPHRHKSQQMEDVPSDGNGGEL